MLFMAFVWENTVCVFCVEKGLFFNAILVAFLFQGSISGGRKFGVQESSWDCSTDRDLEKTSLSGWLDLAKSKVLEP